MLLNSADESTHQAQESTGWKIADVAVLGTLAALIVYTVTKHEPWADEAQAYLIARDLPWLRMVFSELRYEGHPTLWYSILWPLIHAFHLPYSYLGFLGAAFGLAGIAVLVFLAPFPRWLRYLMGASFFFVYQYAVVARSYNLMPLLAFLAAYYYRQGPRRILSFAVAIALLVQVSTHGAFLGGCMSLFYAWPILKRWKKLGNEERRRFLLAAGLIAASMALFLIVVYPPSDTVGVMEAGTLPFSIHLQKTFTALFDALSNTVILSAPFLVIACFWALQRGGLFLLVGSVGGTAAIYGFLRGAQHHVGLVLLALITCLWMVWPTPAQLASSALHFRRLHYVFLASLAIIFAIQVEWSYRAMRNDVAGPYSGARDAAQYLKSVNAEQQGCSGYFFMDVGVAAYFDHNIFQNLGGPEAPSFFHHSLPYARKATIVVPWELRTRYLLLGVNYPVSQAQRELAIMQHYGYALVHVSQGSAFFKNKAGEPQVYLIFERQQNPQP